MRALVLIAVLAWSGAALAADIELPSGSLPDHAKTPGELNSVLTKEKICAKGFRTGPYRHVTAGMKRQVYALYGAQNHKGICVGPEGCEIDHLCALTTGGANTIRNLWVQPFAGPWNAHHKDLLEVRLHKLICAGDLTPEEACAEVSTDWIASWRMRFGRDVP